MDAIQGVLKSTQFIMSGRNVKAFEQEVASYLEVKHAIAVNSGTDALVIALRAAGISDGDEVITTPFTFFATAEAISQVGARPVFVDIDSKTLNIDPEKIPAAITSRTKAIIPVHLYGKPCDMAPIMSLAEEHGLKVIEDCAQSFGSEVMGKKTGAIGDLGCYSFFPSKNLGAYGDGGLIGTNDDELADTCRMLRVHGSRRKYYNETVGYNSRLDEIQGAILRVKLPHIDRWNEGRRRVAHTYNEAFKAMSDIQTPVLSADATDVFHQYTIRVKGGKREQLQKYLSERNIGTMIYYPVPVHQLPIYQNLGFSLQEAEFAATETLSLPIWPGMPEEVQARVIAEIVNFMG